MRFVQKKRIEISALFLLCSMICFSQPSKIVKVWVMPTEGKNLGNADSRWLPNEVHKALRANITNYSGLTIAEENDSLLAEIQKKSYSENINPNDEIRMGRQMGANYAIRSTITKTNSSYNLNIIFQNLESGKHFAESNKNSKDIDSLYMNPGCAVNEATIELCKLLDKDFDTRLSYYNERILRYGANGLSAEDENKYLVDEAKRLNESIKNLSKELNSARLSTEIDTETKKVQLQLKKTQEEEKLKQIKQRQERLMQEAANGNAELEDQKSRSNEQKKRISDAEKILNKKIEALRNQKYDSSSALAQIGVIEAKKKAILEIRQKRESDSKATNEKCELDIKSMKERIMDAPLRAAQKSSSGGMLPEVYAEREKKAKAEEDKIRAEYNNSLKAMNALSINAENALINQIEVHKKEIQKTKKADNIVKRDLKVDVNRFVGENKAWTAIVTFVSEGELLYTTTLDISYKDLTGKEANVLSDEYLDEVDLYNSLFSNNAAPVTAEMTYYFTSAPDSKPSVYILHIDAIKLTHTENGKKIQIIAVNKDIPRQMTPIYDIRDEELKRKIERKQQEKDEQKQEKEKQEAEKKSKSQETKNKIKTGFSNRKTHGTYIAIGANVPINLNVNNESFPVGISIHAISAFRYISVKGNIGWDFIKFKEDTSILFDGSISLGFALAHNDFLFAGLYATAYFDKIENYFYTSYGASGTVIFNLPKNWGIFINCDATFRTNEFYKGDEPIPPYEARFLRSCRICPSIGVSYNFSRR